MRQQPLAPDNIPKIMAMPEAYCPPQDCFQAGTEIFQERFGDIFRQKAIGHSILDVGRQSWLHKLKRNAENEEESDDSKADANGPKEFVWTPEAVARCLEAVCRRCGFMLRRARWLAMLSESTVVWQDRATGTERRRVIQLQGGNVIHRCYIDGSEFIPLPPNCGATIAYRQERLNIETYDRLRVLTTEVRRLLSENRFECIRLSENAYLQAKQMRRLLEWI